jgi:uncharacterized RDD family membrane protein YckC
VLAIDRRRTPQAVCFSPEDYAGLWRRLVVQLIDLVTVAILWVVVTVVIVVGTPAELPRSLVVLGGWATLLFWYFVLLKGSRFRTLGYRLGRVRVVDIRGNPAGVGALTVRLLFALGGPLNLIVDMAWIPSDRFRQSLRDKVAGTYVVRARAEPAGWARIVYTHYRLLGGSFLLQELTPLDADPPLPARRVVRPT